MVKHNMFTSAWLDLPDAEGGFPTNGDRVAAQDICKRMDHEAFTRTGFILQAIAAGWHHKSTAQLRELGDKVGRNRIQVLHGDSDRMITPPHSKVLVDELSTENEKVRYVFVKGRGHVLIWEHREEFTRMVEEWVETTEKLNREEKEKKKREGVEGEGQGESRAE